MFGGFRPGSFCTICSFTNILCTCKHTSVHRCQQPSQNTNDCVSVYIQLYIHFYHYFLLLYSSVYAYTYASMRACVQVCMYVCMHVDRHTTCACAQRCIYLRMQTRMRRCACGMPEIRTRANVCVCVCMPACLPACLQVCRSVSVCVYLSVRPSVCYVCLCLSARMPACRSVCVLYMYIYISLSLSLSLSVYICMKYTNLLVGASVSRGRNASFTSPLSAATPRCAPSCSQCTRGVRCSELRHCMRAKRFQA